MASQELTASIDGFVARLKAATWKERDGVKEELLAFCRANLSDTVTEYLDDVRKTLNLELRWEVDEVIEALIPEPEPETEEEPEVEEEVEEEAADPNAQLSMADLKQVYHDPRGLTLYLDKTKTRWFATQVNPYNGQPQTFELQAEEVEGIKAQLKGSPYWILGSGGAAL